MRQHYSDGGCLLDPAWRLRRICQALQARSGASFSLELILGTPWAQVYPGPTRPGEPRTRYTEAARPGPKWARVLGNSWFPEFLAPGIPGSRGTTHQQRRAEQTSHTSICFYSFQLLSFGLARRAPSTSDGSSLSSFDASASLTSGSSDATAAALRLGIWPKGRSVCGARAARHVHNAAAVANIAAGFKFRTVQSRSNGEIILGDTGPN
jgi:hypothetical protein